MSHRRFTIPGRCQPKQRPRGSGKKHYTPTQTKRYEKVVASAWRAAGLEPVSDLDSLDTPIRATVDVYEDHVDVELEALDGPRSTVRGDCDNLAKGVLDALNEIAYRDDVQITELVVRRHPTAAHVRKAARKRGVS